MSRYEIMIEELFEISKHRSMKYDLSRMKKADQIFEFPTKSYPTIHIAGTNGKGSVASKIAKACELGGYRVGLYTSPHIRSFRERIQINGEYIPKEEVVKLLAKIFEQTAALSLTFFEITTLLAFLYFQKKAVDLAVIETGLGGRLDATNIINPICSVITTIAYDHMQHLGSTLDQIAGEKAGIIKKNTPILLGSSAVFPSILKQAATRKAPVLFVPKEAHISFDQENQQIAREALSWLSHQYPLKSIEQGISYRPPCRFDIKEIEGVTVVFDVAHNPTALVSLNKWLNSQFYGKNFRWCFGASKDKDLQSVCAEIISNAKHVHLVAAPNKRAAEVADLQAVFQALSFSRISHQSTLKKTLHEAFTLASQKRDILVITGTFFIMEECLTLLLDHS